MLVETYGKSVLMDPWLTDGEYYGAWAHWPPYNWEHDLSAIDYIYISHIHPDHFSAATMARLPKVPVLIHAFQAPFLRRNIEALGFDVFELPHNQPFHIGDGVRINILAADDCDPDVCGKFFGCHAPGIRSAQIDSLCVIDDGDKVLVNVNDCPFGLAQSMLAKLTRQYPSVDLLMGVYAGAGPYPQCFKMPEEQKRAAAAAKEKAFIDQLFQFSKAMKAKVTMPFAGDYLLCGSLAHLNQYRGVPTIDSVHASKPAGMVTLGLDHGASWEVGAATPNPTPTDQDAKDKYVADVLSKRRLDYEDDPMPELSEIISLLEKAVQRMTARRKEMGFESSTGVFIELQEGAYFHVPMSEHTDVSKFVKIGCDHRLLKRILTRRAHWNTAEIGSHLTFERKPDHFERGLHHMVSFLHV